MELSNLSEWLFNYNPYTKNWRAIKRDHYLELFSTPEGENPNILASSDMNTLIWMIGVTNGDQDKISKLLKTNEALSLKKDVFEEV